MRQRQDPPSLVFFGTRELGARVLERLCEAGFVPALVVTSPDMPAGRKKEPLPSPVKKVAQSHGLQLAQPEQPVKLLSRPELQEAEVIVLAAYGKILPQELVELPPKGALNAHPSLLPKYRGPAPERAALLNGDAKTGVSVILMDEEVDHGPILARREFAIPPNMRHEALHQALGEFGGELLVEILPQWLEGAITPRPQDHSQATFTKHVRREDGRVDWNKSAQDIFNMLRAFDPWPGVYTFWNGKRLKILDASPWLSQGSNLGLAKEPGPGTVLQLPDGGLGVQTGEGALRIDRLQLEGKNPMGAKEFLLGHPDIIGSTLNRNNQ